MFCDWIESGIWIVKKINVFNQNEKKLKLQLIVTCMHLSANFGNTFHEIKNDGFKIDYKADLKIKNSSVQDICKYMGKELSSYQKHIKS